MKVTARPRAWPVSAISGAYAVIFPCAIAAGGASVAFARRVGVGLAGSSSQLDQHWLEEATGVALRFAGGVILAGTVVGVPVAMLVAGIMALLERHRPYARRLAAWLGESIVAVIPVVLLGFAITGTAVFALPLLACALIGGAVAWAVRHRLFAR